VLTPMLAHVADVIGTNIGENPDELLATMVPAQLNRHIQPREVGKVIAFLLSDAAVIIRGQSINVDGGDTPY
jgi:NAD(P)-dependent dehydrogenase (short-subunit alcohol dehydrogenase family)